MYTQIRFDSYMQTKPTKSGGKKRTPEEMERAIKIFLEDLESDHPSVTFIRKGDSIFYAGSSGILDVDFDHWDLMVASKTSYLEFLDNAKLSDITIRVSDGKQRRKYRLHRIVLANCTDFFDINLEDSKTIILDEPLDLFDDLINIIYGKPTILFGVRGLRILQMMDKYGVKFKEPVGKEFEMKDYIDEMRVPGTNDLVEYVKTLAEVYPNMKDLYLGDLMDEIIEVDLFDSIKEYLPKSVRNIYEDWHDSDTSREESECGK